MSTQANLPKVIFEIVKYLYDTNIFSLEPENIVIVREGRRDIFPCARAYPRGLDLGQLEWSAKTGHFWFSGPVKGIKVLIDKGLLRGTLFLGLNTMTFDITVNTLNFENFSKIASKLKSIAVVEGLKIEFNESRYGIYNVDLVIIYNTSLSIENVKQFLTKVKRVFSYLQRR